jgi:nucleoside 2-deoxyribosyltransferase
MDYVSQRVERWIKTGESETVVFKESMPPEHVLARDLVALANSRGGVVLLGVVASNHVPGLASLEATTAAKQLRQVSDSLLQGAAMIGVVPIDGNLVVYASVQPAPDHLKPIVTSRGEAYRREGPTTVPLETDKPVVATRHTVRVFVAMSFREEEEPALADYWRAMQRAAVACELPIEVFRIDLAEGDYEISQAIMDQIDWSDVVLADFTLGSRNVYFELGYARGKGKRILQTARTDAPREFDVRNWKTIVYRNATELEEKLKPAFQAAYVAVTAG